MTKRLLKNSGACCERSKAGADFVECGSHAAALVSRAVLGASVRIAAIFHDPRTAWLRSERLEHGSSSPNFCGNLRVFSQAAKPFIALMLAASFCLASRLPAQSGKKIEMLSQHFNEPGASLDPWMLIPKE